MPDIIELSEATFDQEVLHCDLPVLIDMWAPWCEPCHTISRFVVEIAADYEGRIKVAKMNIDDNMAFTKHFKIESIPTLMLFKNRKLVARKTGVMPKNGIEAMIKPHISET
ncbi:MAG: thioredoxin [Candidatus Electryoneaceae bacterium]|nr:thioredoxin [Candidatus Electryoneaceae bacterium]